jgi:hypothetical protein
VEEDHRHALTHNLDIVKPGTRSTFLVTRGVYQAPRLWWAMLVITCSSVREGVQAYQPH